MTRSISAPLEGAEWVIFPSHLEVECVGWLEEGGGDVFEEVQNRDGFYSLDLLDEEGNKWSTDDSQALTLNSSSMLLPFG